MLKKLKLTLAACVLPLIAAAYGVITLQWTVSFNSAFTVVCIVGFFLVDKKFRLFSLKVYILVLIFILLSVFSGRSLGLYGKIPGWDKCLHFLSGFILVIFGKRIFEKLGGNATNKVLMKIFSFLAGAAGAGFWEIFEFSCDRIIGTVAQNNSLTDTMWDIILGTLSAALGAVFIK